MSACVRCGIYVRISDDRGGEALGVGRQEDDCRALAERLGWTVVEVYRENDCGAFKRRRVTLPDGTTVLRVVRDAFRDMLADADAGAINAIIGYDLDRVARDPRDLEDLVDLAEVRKLQVRSVTGSLRLDDDSGITMARVMVAVANKSSRDTSRRVIRKHQELAKAGKPPGGGHRNYGYTMSMKAIVPEEAQILHEIAEAILSGDSLSAIARDLTERQVPTVRQLKDELGGTRAWNPRSVHSVVTKAAVAGLRTYKGEVMEQPAVWPAIISRDTWERVCMKLNERAEGHDNRLKRWLSGVLRCSLCGVGLGGASGNSGARYWCRPSFGGCGKIVVNVRVESVIRDFVIGYLTRPDVAAALNAASNGSSTDAARQALRDDQAQLRELAELWAKKEISTKEFLPARRIIEERMGSYEAVLRRALPSGVRELLTAANIAEAFDGLGPHEKRRVVDFLMPGGVHVLPARTRGRFEPGRVVPAFVVKDKDHLAQITRDWLAGVDPIWPPLTAA